ncbi:MAG: hypothetical protein Q8Q31_05350 [Nanoarchaeota archaeon]|nr:hypothetical protein [Nanoarchaeota archaeon]
MSNLESITNNESNPCLFRRISDFGSKFIDYKMGLIGAGIMSSLVFGVNYYETQELLGSSTAALKQAAYTFFVGGLIIKSCEYLATRIKNKSSAIANAIILPSALTLTLTYGMHNLKGTPEPERSTIPTIVIIPATAYWATRKRRQHDDVSELLEKNN